jgi:hypothetical protein
MPYGAKWETLPAPRLILPLIGRPDPMMAPLTNLSNPQVRVVHAVANWRELRLCLRLLPTRWELKMRRLLCGLL